MLSRLYLHLTGRINSADASAAQGLAELELKLNAGRWLCSGQHGTLRLPVLMAEPVCRQMVSRSLPS